MIWLRSADGRWMLAVLAVALVVRLIVALSVTPDPRDGRYDDSVWYDTTARHLAAGRGYVFDPTVWVTATGDRIYPDENELTPTALWPPGYPITLAVVYALTDDSVTAGRLMNVAFGALTAALVYLIALKLFDRRTAAIAGLALAFMPSHVLFTSVLLSETYFGFLLALILAVCAYFVFDRPKPNLPVIFGLGVLIAATGYVRGEFIAFGGIVAVLMLFQYRQRAALPLLALAVGAALIITPWTLRNRDSMGETIVGTTGAGRVVYQGHNEKTDGGPSLEAFWRLEEDYKGLSRQEIELKANEDGLRLAREWAWDNKLRELQLVGLRMHLLMKTDEAGVTWLQSNKPWFSTEGADRLIFMSTAYFYALAALLLASAPAWFRWRDRRMWVVFSIIPFYMLIFGVLFIGDPRYHYAMYLPLAIFAAPGISMLMRITAQQWREISGGRSFGSVLRTYGTPDRAPAGPPAGAPAGAPADASSAPPWAPPGQ